ncbi:Uma2 family endonuclease [Roseateles amylovorans]|uniref:Uma2 family endonuclease n=1 Tax=Roseateles amylovorans TaxID=2978473 RepID=A0ABY6B3U4_9BURK|nr:Uma2 family endonuclease [Roseateles amylovorans]UXH78198.1 Uma2 family endonuclease [Roseateles amylovorans]
MTSLHRKRLMTADDYLAWEARQPTKHEFVDGTVIEMAGAEDHHVTVVLNVALALKRHLQGKGCRTYASDRRLHVADARTHSASHASGTPGATGGEGAYFYPDVMVTCHPDDHATRLSKSRPTLLVEVSSPSTRQYDRATKLAHYRRIEALQEYVLIDLMRRVSDLHRRSAAGHWETLLVQPDQPLVLKSVGLHLAANDLWADVDPAPSTLRGAARGSGLSGRTDGAALAVLAGNTDHPTDDTTAAETAAGSSTPRVTLPLRSVARQAGSEACHQAPSEAPQAGSPAG